MKDDEYDVQYERCSCGSYIKADSLHKFNCVDGGTLTICPLCGHEAAYAYDVLIKAVVPEELEAFKDLFTTATVH